MQPPFEIGGELVGGGTRRHLEIPIARLPTGSAQSLPVIVLHGNAAGPRVWLSAAIHGDELNGIEIVRQVLERLDPKTLSGTVVAVPVVNVFGFVTQSRYLPDRRDLNRSFPGSPKGSLAARLAHLFMQEIVGRCTHGIDFHTGSLHRTNFPHIRGDLDSPETLRCARAFGTRLLVHARTRDGSLRLAAAKRGIPCLVYEAGDANRFNREPVRIGVDGIQRVLAELNMIEGPRRPVEPVPTIITETRWVRARRSGLLRLRVTLGELVKPRQTLGVITDAIGIETHTVRAPTGGFVLGLHRSPFVHRGDSLVHLALPPN